jgi:hypothetical protein
MPSYSVAKTPSGRLLSSAAETSESGRPPPNAFCDRSVRLQCSGKDDALGNYVARRDGSPSNRAESQVSGAACNSHSVYVVSLLKTRLRCRLVGLGYWNSGRCS